MCEKCSQWHLRSQIVEATENHPLHKTLYCSNKCDSLRRYKLPPTGGPAMFYNVTYILLKNKGIVH